MRKNFRRAAVAVGAILAMAGCGPVDDSEVQVAADSQAPEAVNIRRCGNPNFDPEMVAQIEARFEALKAKQALSRRVTAMESVSIPVWFHVIRWNPMVSDGNIPSSRLDNQIAVLNNAFWNSGLNFYRAGTDTSYKTNWYFYANYGNSYDAEMKNALRKGSADDLNIYIVGPRSDVLGWATFPWNYSFNPKMDGVVVVNTSLPGGSSTYYNEGDTAVHEVGHWLGLYHTFEGGCASPGDGVSDTAPEASPGYGCPMGRDTCFSDDQFDPVINYMDYSYDSCMFMFSGEQALRMNGQWTMYRSGR